MNYNLIREKLVGLYGKAARGHNVSNDPHDRENEIREFHEDVGFIAGCIEGLILALEVSTNKTPSEIERGKD